MTSPDGIHVLVVDDVEVIRTSVGALLAAYPSIREVTFAEDGHAAIQAVAERTPDVVLMDLRMPRLDGLSAARIIRRRFPRVGIVIHSAYEQETMLARTDELDVTYFTKGRPVRDLVALLEETFARQSVL